MHIIAIMVNIYSILACYTPYYISCASSFCLWDEIGIISVFPQFVRDNSGGSFFVGMGVSRRVLKGGHNTEITVGSLATNSNINI